MSAPKITHRTRIVITVDIDVWHGPRAAEPGAALELVERLVGADVAKLGLASRVRGRIGYTIREPKSRREIAP